MHCTYQQGGNWNRRGIYRFPVNWQEAKAILIRSGLLAAPERAWGGAPSSVPQLGLEREPWNLRQEGFLPNRHRARTTACGAALDDAPREHAEIAEASSMQKSVCPRVGDRMGVSTRRTLESEFAAIIDTRRHALAAGLAALTAGLWQSGSRARERAESSRPDRNVSLRLIAGSLVKGQCALSSDWLKGNRSTHASTIRAEATSRARRIGWCPPRSRTMGTPSGAKSGLSRARR